MLGQIPDPSPGPKYWFFFLNILIENYGFSMLGQIPEPSPGPKY